MGVHGKMSSEVCLRQAILLDKLEAGFTLLDRRDCFANIDSRIRICWFGIGGVFGEGWS